MRLFFILSLLAITSGMFIPSLDDLEPEAKVPVDEESELMTLAQETTTSTEATTTTDSGQTTYESGSYTTSTEAPNDQTTTTQATTASSTTAAETTTSSRAAYMRKPYRPRMWRPVYPKRNYVPMRPMVMMPRKMVHRPRPVHFVRPPMVRKTARINTLMHRPVAPPRVMRPMGPIGHQIVTRPMFHKRFD
ncbi:hypothetical protein BpHYR1_046322 [Brachionus plicatilis]|uniref:Uncharacterized protein n=1 Tax=Brachionus plicatilis TaxID=10195 RepID=A0A3M7QHH3_BRAPC|nr:hypothetical protein BpHYR1_046322 [Brachionus plicatilis]